MNLAFGGSDDALLLDVLRGLARNPAPSQRAVAKRLGVSVGKTHYLLRALIDKGLVKLENVLIHPSRASYLYVLTPRGVAMKARLTRRFLQQKMGEYERLKVEIKQLARETSYRA
jgi:EPS-associated MarR family transcriptional regulator